MISMPFVYAECGGTCCSEVKEIELKVLSYSCVVEELQDDGWIVVGDEKDILSLSVFCSQECEEKYYSQ